MEDFDLLKSFRLYYDTWMTSCNRKVVLLQNDESVVDVSRIVIPYLTFDNHLCLAALLCNCVETAVGAIIEINVGQESVVVQIDSIDLPVRELNVSTDIHITKESVLLSSHQDNFEMDQFT